jgi:hypothetical protein
MKPSQLISYAVLIGVCITPFFFLDDKGKAKGNYVLHKSAYIADLHLNQIEDLLFGK